MAKLEFNSSLTSFSLINALFLVEAADLVNRDLNSIQNDIQEKLGLLQYKPFDCQDTQAFLSANDEIILLVFRGTTTRRDWSTDLNIKFVPSQVGRIHRGFNAALDYVWKDIRQRLLEFRDKDQSIWIAGHSLGGALATLAADRITEEGLEVRGLCTFGQPCVGDKIFASNFDNKIKSRTFRFVHDEDVVPKLLVHIPGYCHIGREYYFDRDGKLYTDRIVWHRLISRCISMSIRNSEKASELSAQNPGGLRDHGLSYYKQCIMKNLIKEKGGPRNFNEYINY